MAESARVDSIDALKNFRISLLKFAEICNVGLGDAESEVQRTMNWLENEQMAFWEGQVRKRQEMVSRTKEAIRQKEIFKDSSGRTVTAIEERKALTIALRRVEEAEQKISLVKKHIRKLEKEFSMYKGSVQMLGTMMVSDVPVAAAQLDKLVRQLEQYAGLAAPTLLTSTPLDQTSMAQAADEAANEEELRPPIDPSHSSETENPTEPEKKP